MTAARAHVAVGEPLAARIRAGDRSAIARALNLLDDARPAARADAVRLLGELPSSEERPGAHLIGFTGPPGAGKSSLISALIAHWRAQQLSVGVLAVDPSSHVSGGALLGDRLRMRVCEDDEQVFIRSLASRGSYGGLAPQLLPMATIMLSAFDRVVIETVGVGQREVDVAFAADTTCLVVQPGAGDSVQFLKAGIMEVPDLLVVNKSDLGEIAARAYDELVACTAGHTAPTVLATSAIEGDGIATLGSALDDHHSTLLEAQRLAAMRRNAQLAWTLDRLREEFGSHGIACAGGKAALVGELSRDDRPIVAQLPRARALVLDALATSDHKPTHSTPTTTR